MEEIVDLYGQADQEMMYQAAIRQPLERKVEQAIALLRTYEGQALSLSPNGYYGCFSGGKDSIVIAKLMEMAGVQHNLNYANVTIDPPELVQFIKKKYPHVIWHNVGIHLTDYIALKSCGPPVRNIRWCCEIYKEQGGNGLVKVVGVRAAESARRKGLWSQVKVDTRNGLLPIISPILYWTDADVWEFIRGNNMEYCCLYDEGFTRLGCVGCPMGGPDKQRREFQRWPQYEKLWKRGFAKYWAKWKGVPRKDGGERWFEKFPTVDAFWEWWVSGKAYEGEQADCQMWLW